MLKSELLELLKDVPDDGQVVIGVIMEKEESFEIGQDSDTSSSEDDEDGGPVDNGDGTQTDYHDIAGVTIMDDIEDMEDGTERPIKFAVLELDIVDDEDEDDEEESDEDGNDSVTN